MESQDIMEDKENSGIPPLITKYRKHDKEKDYKSQIRRGVKYTKVSNDTSKRQLDKIKIEVKDLYEEKTSYQLKLQEIIICITTSKSELQKKERQIQA